MNIHEYQAKEVLRQFGVATLKGQVATTAEEAVLGAQTMGGSLWVVKAQIHAGGRGKGGGVKIAKSLDEVKTLASQILGMTLVTHQTGPQGKHVQKIYVEQGCNIEKEYYVAVLVDRVTKRIGMIASSEGGVEIEEVAAHRPDAIKKVNIDPVVGLTTFQARHLAYEIGIPQTSLAKAAQFFLGLYQAFVAKDASMAEINPLVLTKEGDLIALDAKMNFDSNALFRHSDILEYRDLSEEEPTEIEASKHDLAFIKLDGNIGCLVNGAGLAMATLDIIKLHGQMPANFLDVGGGANKERVTEAFKIILQDANVKAILVNIFGGIMKCDVIAEGVVAASKEIGLQVPLVVRLEGTNVELGKEILKNSGLNIIPAHDLNDAATKVVAAVKGAR
jgi:succinyl-CoA synthetase beta subunit